MIFQNGDYFQAKKEVNILNVSIIEENCQVKWKIFTRLQ